MAKIVQIQMFEANDGSQFATAAEADSYDFKLEHAAKIEAAGEAFCNTVGKIDRARVQAMNLVGEFLAFYIPWQEAGMPEVERTAFDTPKKEIAAEVVADGVEVDATVEATEGQVEVAEGELFQA